MEEEKSELQLKDSSLEQIEEKDAAVTVANQKPTLAYTPVKFNPQLYEDTHLDLADLEGTTPVGEDVQNFFICTICTMVVQNPQECEECNTLFCEACIQVWLKKRAFCPKMCKGEDPMQFRKLHRLVMANLNSMKFRCNLPGCDKVHEYLKAMEHIRSCDYSWHACPMGCGLGFQKKDLELHVKHLCQQVKEVCERCGLTTYPNKEEAEHDCVTILKQQLSQLQSDNESLVRKMCELQIKVSEKEEEAPVQNLLRPIEQRNNEAMSEALGAGKPKYCMKAHLMVKATSNVYAKLGKASKLLNKIGMQPVLFPRCDFCAKFDLSKDAHFFHCDTCRFDLCSDCSSRWDC